jgi:heme exporter protein B
MWRDAALVAGKDLRIEARTRVAANQVGTFAVVVLLLFGFALDADRALLQRVAPGLYWVTVLLAGVLAIQRGFAVEAGPGARDILRLAGLEPAGVFLGKAAAIAIELVAVEVLLAVGAVVIYGSELAGPAVLLSVAALATIGLSACGAVYGAMAVGVRMRETLVPLLLLPVVAPVLLAATRASEAALAGTPGEATTWLAVLAVFAALYLALGLLGFGALMEVSA